MSNAVASTPIFTPVKTRGPCSNKCKSVWRRASGVDDEDRTHRLRGDAPNQQFYCTNLFLCMWSA